MLSPTENRIQGLFQRNLSDYPVVFKEDLIFKDFSRKPSKLKYFSSLCEPGVWDFLFVHVFAPLLLALKEFTLDKSRLLLCFRNLFNSVYRNSLIWVHIFCPYTYIKSNNAKKYAADNIRRRHFQIFFVSALRVK